MFASLDNADKYIDCWISSNHRDLGVNKFKNKIACHALKSNK